MIKTISKKVIFVFLIILVVSGTFFVHTKTSRAVVEIKEYTVLAPLPGTTKGGGNCVGADCKADLASYIPGLFNLIIGLAAVVAVAYIIYGGFLYITTDAIMGKEEGKKHINNAIYGLIMISVAWLILYTINPRILEFKLNIDAITVPSGPGGTLGVPMTAEQIAESNAIRTSLSNEGVNTYAGPCTNGQTTGCVNLNGLPAVALDGLAALGRNCPGCLNLSGGTEAGHETHGIGRPIIDSLPSQGLNQYLDVSSPTNRQTVTKVIRVQGKPDVTATFTYETAGGGSSGNHWHIVFS